MIRVMRGDLLAQPVDCIVNPANGFLRHGAGLARVIDQAAQGYGRRWDADPQKIGQWNGDHRDARRGGPIATGAVHVTSAGCLPFKGVVHAVGPVWGGGKLHELDLLQAVHVNACEAALAHGWESIGFPAISCGLFRFPVRYAAPIALGVANDYKSRLQVTFALFEDEHYSAYTDAAVAVSAGIQ